MNEYIRVKLGFFSHRKTRKLIAKFGLDTAWGILQLWAFAAEFRCSGYLTEMSDQDIAVEMHMEDKADPSELVALMKSDGCRWLDDTPDGVYLHNWRIHQPHLKIISLSKRPYSKVWKKIKDFILLRDNKTCAYCGITLLQMECDHITPIARGGDNSIGNLTTACPTCNRKKGKKTLEEWKR